MYVYMYGRGWWGRQALVNIVRLVRVVELGRFVAQTQVPAALKE